MPQLTSKQADDLANQFLGLAQAIGDFRNTHWNELTTKQHQQLSKQHIAVLTLGEDILALSTVLVMNEVSNSLGSIRDITQKIKATLTVLDRIDDAIAITTAVVKLGSAIVSENPVTITGAIEDLWAKWKSRA